MTIVLFSIFRWKQELKEGVLPINNLPLKLSKTPEENKEPRNILSIEKQVLTTILKRRVMKVKIK